MTAVTQSAPLVLRIAPVAQVIAEISYSGYSLFAQGIERVPLP